MNENLSITELFGVKDKITLILGVGGIGEVLAEGFGVNGAKLILGDISSNALSKVKEKLSAMGIAAETYCIDVSDKSDIQNVFDSALNKNGSIDVVIVTSGVSRNARAIDFDENDIDQILKINLKGTMLCNQVAGKIMAAQKRGKIINIGSIAGHMAHTYQSMPYAASKAGVHQVTRTFAAELAEYGINVNSIAPTWVSTPMMKGRPASYYENIGKVTPLGRMCTPNELVGAAIFLATEASNFITGQILFVDGGWSISKAIS